MGSRRGSRWGPQGDPVGSTDWGVHILYQLLGIARVVQFSHENVLLHPTIF